MNFITKLFGRNKQKTEITKTITSVEPKYIDQILTDIFMTGSTNFKGNPNTVDETCNNVMIDEY